MELAYKNILIVGLGMTGIAAARFVKNKGASVTVTDIAREEELLSSDVSGLHEMGIRMELGQHRIETFERADLIVISPGVPHTILPIKKAKEKGVPVMGEIELASRFIRNVKVSPVTTPPGTLLSHSRVKCSSLTSGLETSSTNSRRRPTAHTAAPAMC